MLMLWRAKTGKDACLVNTGERWGRTQLGSCSMGTKRSILCMYNIGTSASVNALAVSVAFELIVCF